MLSRLFRAYGRICAAHPWEVIITCVTLMLCLVPMSVNTNPHWGKICGWNYICPDEEEPKTSDIMILTITRCLAVIYVYLQFRNLRRLGSKYLLGIAGVFTIFSSFVFSIALLNLVGSDLKGLHEALPFFMMLVDLAKATALARFTLSSATQDEVQDNIGNGMAIIGPAITLDAFVETLVIGVGTRSGVKQLETMCCFGCLSVIANYVAFLTFYPACLSIILEVLRERNQGQPLQQLQQLAKILQAEEEEKKPNPVTERVKIIMSAGLLLVHLQSRFVAGSSAGQGPQELQTTDRLTDQSIQPTVSLWHFYMERMLTVNMEYTISLVLALGLIINYIVFGNDIDPQLQSMLEKEKSECNQGEKADTALSEKAVSFDTSHSQKAICADTTQSEKAVSFRISHCEKAVPIDTTRSEKAVPFDTTRSEKAVPFNTTRSEKAVPFNTTRSEKAVPFNTTHSEKAVPFNTTRSEKAVPFNTTRSEKAVPFDTTRSEKAVPFDTTRSEKAVPADTAHCTQKMVENEAKDTLADVPDKAESKTVFFCGGDEETSTQSKETQTEGAGGIQRKEASVQPSELEPRDLKTCIEIMNSEQGPAALTNTEVVSLVESKHIPFYKIEKMVGDYERGVGIRRQSIQQKLASSEALRNLPFTGYNYKYVDGACCENVIGYMPVPVGVAGPLLLNGKSFMVPMATTEGCLVASVNRGCSVLRQSGGVSSMVYRDGMTRAPVVEFPSTKEAVEALFWLENKDNVELVKQWFNSTSRFARLQNLSLSLCDRQLYIRFVSTTGDAMGMNMMSKGCEKALKELQTVFPEMRILSLSGNVCADKKPAAINWVEGRGKSVVCSATIPGPVVHSVLKTTTAALVDLNIKKNLQGSAMAGSVGGFNAHAANMVTAIYIATGQDPAQTVASANCITTMTATGPMGEDLYMSCTMPSLELGTVGGGTVLPPQSACLEMLGVKGSDPDNPCANARQLASIICSTVLAGELSLMSALAAGHLVRSHLKHNRSTINLAPASGLQPAIPRAPSSSSQQQKLPTAGPSPSPCAQPPQMNDKSALSPGIQPPQSTVSSKPAADSQPSQSDSQPLQSAVSSKPASDNQSLQSDISVRPASDSEPFQSVVNQASSSESQPLPSSVDLKPSASDSQLQQPDNVLVIASGNEPSECTDDTASLSDSGQPLHAAVSSKPDLSSAPPHQCRTPFLHGCVSP